MAEKDTREEEWGEGLFQKAYENQLRKLLLNFSLVTDSTITLSLNGEPRFTVPKDGQNSFCKSLRQTEWGLAECLKDERDREALAQSTEGNMVEKTCYMGFENIASTFEIAGLGIIGIHLGRLPTGSRDLAHRIEKKLHTARRNTSITFAEEKHLGFLTRQLRHKDSISKISKSLFNQIVALIRELLDAGVERSLLTSSTLHEICLSLAATSGAAAYILERTNSPDWIAESNIRSRIQNNIETVTEQLSLAGHLSENLLDYHTTKGKFDAALTTRELIDFNVEILNIAQLWARAASSRGIEIRTVLDTDAKIIGDPILLRRLLHNLLSNAVKYSYTTGDRSEQRFIDINLHRYDPGFREERVAMTISNYGIGIPKDEMGKLGRPGFRGRYATKEQPLGLGIGVYIAMRAAKLHGGEIKYDSEYLHDSHRIIRGKKIDSETYLTEVTLILPTT